MTDNNRMPADKHSRKKLVMLYTSIIMLLFFAVIFGSTAIFLLYSDKGNYSGAASIPGNPSLGMHMSNTLISGTFIDNKVIEPIDTKPSVTAKPAPDTPSSSTLVPAQEPELTPTPIPTPTPEPEPSPEPAPSPTPAPAPSSSAGSVSKKKIPGLISNAKGKRDEQGRLLKFADLLEANGDVKGWIKGHNIDYPVLQSSKNDPEFYLNRNFFGEYYKAGSLFLDPRSSVETPTQNFVIHGHNMISTPEKMFHYIKFYADVSYYKKHPVITFDTIYEEADYKVFAIIKTTPKVKEDYFFEFRQSTFKDASKFLNFVYQVRIRSLIIVDDVDINENDTLLTLATCSYEVDNDYRTVVFARKIREGENPKVDLMTVKVNKKPLYCDDYYKEYGGKPPKLPATFEEALEKGYINWYKPAD